MAKRRSRPQPSAAAKAQAKPQQGQPSGAKPHPSAATGEPGAPGPPAHQHYFPLWVVIGIFLVLEVAIILSLRSKWQYRTVIAHAKAAMAEGRWKDALYYWKEHAENYPGAVSTVPYRTDRARSRMGAGDYAGALDDLNFVLNKLNESGKSPDADTLSDMAKCQAELGQTEKALDTYRKVLKVDPNNAPANLYIGRSLLKKGKILEAASRFQSVPVDKYPEDIKKEWHVIEQKYIKKAEQQASLQGATTPTLSSKTAPIPPATTLTPAPTAPASGARPGS